mmetsp:Transcript_21514/g.50098  ORF Transcript_21514/g.50098 Transcript_21514/m.50098 type:complete len:299 (-) Transcript_21514:379-1275(-)
MDSFDDLVQALLFQRVEVRVWCNSSQAALACARVPTPAADGHIGTVTRGQVDAVDSPWNLVQPYAVFCQQLHVAFHAVIAPRRDFHKHLHGRKDQPPANPLAGLCLQRRSVLAVNQSKHVFLTNIRAFFRPYEICPQTSEALFLQHTHATDIRDFRILRLHVHEAYNGQLLFHVGNLRWERPRRTLDDKRTMQASTCLDGRTVVVVRMIPMRTALVVLPHFEIVDRGRPWGDFHKDRIRMDLSAIQGDVLLRRDMEPMGVQICCVDEAHVRFCILPLPYTCLCYFRCGRVVATQIVLQ